MLWRLLELVNKWEIQLLVLLSFALQLFLFFAGSLRQRSKNWLLRGTIWIAYLGADIVAIYALGFLSRHADATTDNHAGDALRLAHPLAFLWAPFLLIHLGGQDTITAFAMEDNSLWLRHLLNLLVQVALALYVFWKSSSWHSTEVLAPGILLFVAGIIKYGERTAALMHGNLNNMVVSNDDPFGSGVNDLYTNDGATVTSIINRALHSAPRIRMFFAGNKTPESWEYVPAALPQGYPDMLKFMEVELGMVYNDLYTKAAVLRTKSGIVFRCISLACTIAALILFLFFFTSSTGADHGGTATNDDTGTAGRVADTAITYTLFIGGLVVDICTLLTMLVASPWTWAWLRDRGHRRIARISLCLLSCDMVSGWLGTTRPLWSNTMGQYRFVCYDNDSEPWSSSPPPTLWERAMGIIRKQVGAEGEKNLFWLSKMLETKDVAVDEDVTVCLVKAIDGIYFEDPDRRAEQWPCLGKLLLAATRPAVTRDFVRFISWLHACTEVLLCEAAAAAAAATMGISIATGTGTAAAASADVCRKLSRYMMYLVAAHPAAASLLLVVSSNPEVEFQRWGRYSRNSLKGQQQRIREGLLRSELSANERRLPQEQIRKTLPPSDLAAHESALLHAATEFTPLMMALPSPEQWQETLEELKQMWARLVVYAASKSRPEAHAADLARGGELLAFVWLLFSHRGDVDRYSDSLRVRLVRDQLHLSGQTWGGTGRTLYAFDNLPGHKYRPWPAPSS